MKILSYLFLGSALSAVEVELDLAIQPESNTTVSYRIGSILTPEPTPLPTQDDFMRQLSYGGNITATAEVNQNTGTIESIQFTGGAITTENIINEPLTITLGTFSFDIFFSSIGITRTTSSDEVDILTGGNIDNSLHFTTFSGGTHEVTNFNASLGTSVTESTDLATEASTLISPASVFTSLSIGTNISTQRLSSDTLSDTYLAAFSTFIQTPALLPQATIQAAGLAPNQQFRQQYSEFGFLNAQGTFTIPTPFAQWALDQGITLVTGNEVNVAGLPYALIYALELDLQAASLPLTLTNEDGTIIGTLQLPPGGLLLDIGVLQTSSLELDFEPLDNAFLLDGPNSLNASSTGTARISFPTGPGGFIRFFATL